MLIRIGGALKWKRTHGDSDNQLVECDNHYSLESSREYKPVSDSKLPHNHVSPIYLSPFCIVWFENIKNCLMVYHTKKYVRLDTTLIPISLLSSRNKKN